MHVEKDGDVCWITLSSEGSEWVKLWPELEDQYPEGHWVLIWPAPHISEAEVEFLTDRREERAQSQRSLVLLSDQLDCDQLPEELNLAPTRQEAIDLIDMEKMQWDLGL